MTCIFPGYSLDITRTDGKGDQEEYVFAVRSWSSSHDKFPDSKSGKIPKVLRWIMLRSHLYGRAEHQCKDVLFDEIDCKDGVDKICKTLHKKLTSLLLIMFTVTFKIYYRQIEDVMKISKAESLFAAAIAKINSLGSKTLPESLT